MYSVRTLRILYRGMLFLMKEGKATTLHKKKKKKKNTALFSM